MGDCYECKDVFPHVQKVVEALCRKFGEAKHHAIVSELMSHPEASGLIEIAVGRCDHLSRKRIASNMVQFLSQHYTMDLKDADEFQMRFQRRRLGDGWAYSFR